MTFLSDQAIARLRDAAAWPELDDRYTITGVAGRGGSGTVYIARDRVLDRDVAVKVVDVADRAGRSQERLSREAMILAKLDHPGIVPVHDRGVLPDGRAFYAMKLVRGRRLAEAASGSILADRLALFARVLDAVGFAHAHGVVHRDLKPDNVLVGEFGEVYVMDWGAASSSALPDAEPAVVGTPGFMPPEQAEAGPVDARADVFALGAVLAGLIGDGAPRPLAAIARKAAARETPERYQTVREMAADLAHFRDGLPVTAYRESPAERLLRIYRLYELPILLVLAYLLMRVALLAWKGI